jgi:uncharacterized protein DUF6152
MKIIILVASLLLATIASAHHSYAMFDGSRTLTVDGTVAKLEWMNPHVFVWIYVSNPKAKDGYDLYAFENGSPNVLTRLGWTKTVLTVGEKISVEYWPLKDGRNGGHFLKATHAQGQVLYGAGGPNAIKGELVPIPPGPADSPSSQE